MQNNQLIESGILESYLLGLASESEQADVKYYVDADPELMHYIFDLDKDLQSFFLTNSVPPPPEIRDELELRVGRNELQKNGESRDSGSKKKVYTEEKPKDDYLEIEVNDTHIRVHKLWRPAFFIVFLLSKVFLILALYYFFKTGSLEDELNRLREQNIEIQKK